MPYFITARVRSTVTLQLLRSVLILCPILLAACATAYRPAAGGNSGYSQEQLSRNVFVIAFGSGKAVAPDTATDLCLLRCAEVTLAHGFSHFVVLETRSDLATGNSILARKGIASRSTSGNLTYVSAQPATPSPTNTIACFRIAPTQFSKTYDAKAVREEMSGRYQVKQKLASPELGQLYKPQFDLDPVFLFLPQTTPDQIAFWEPNSPRRSIRIGELTEWENPYDTLAEFKEKSAVAGAVLGGQAIRIHDAAGSEGFRAELLLVPRAHLGIRDEAGDWPRKEMVIRGFDPESLAPRAGLKVGDRIISLDGTDVLRQKRFAECWLSWKAGEVVVVTFIRDGTKMTTQATTIVN